MIHNPPTEYCLMPFIAAFLLLFPEMASAHLVTTGMGPVYDGAGHFLMTPEDLIPGLAIALYAGLRGARSGRLTLFLFPLSWFLGGIAGLFIPSEPPFPIAILSFLLLGGLIATDLYLPDKAITVLITGIGTVHGFYNGAAMAGGPGFSGLIGIACALFVLVSLASAFIISLKPEWTKVAVRVTGSWIAAVGILMLGWAVKANS